MTPPRTPQRVRVLLADDNAVLRMGLRSLLESSDELEVVAEAADGAEAVALAREHHPDVAVLDIRMPGTDGIQAAAQMPEGTRSLMLTYTEDPDVIRAALASGATGYLVHGAHQPGEIVTAVLGAARGTAVLGPAAAATLLPGRAPAAPPQRPADVGHDLTEREREIMVQIAEGRSNRDIARALVVAEKTVKNHVNRIFAKLGVASRAEAVSRWLRTPALERPPATAGDLGPDLGPWAHDTRRKAP